MRIPREARAKQEAMSRQNVLYHNAESVTDELFQTEDFFDPHDLIQVKYEMLRRVRADDWSVTRAVDSLVSLLDIFPTLTDLLSIPRPPWLQGYSLLPLLNGAVTEVRDEVFSEITFHAAYQPMRSVRTKRYKYIRNFGPPRPVPANIDDGLTKTFILERGLLDQEVAEEMLFDLDLDPTERVNLAAHPTYEKVRADLSDLLVRWMEETDDPLRHGKVPVPEGARINAQSCISAEEERYE